MKFDVVGNHTITTPEGRVCAPGDSATTSDEVWARRMFRAGHIDFAWPRPKKKSTAKKKASAKKGDD